MKCTFFFFGFLAWIFCGITTLAQNTMMAGKIVDEDGNPLRGAIIQLKQGKAMLQTRSDDDGLFYTQLLPEGNYKIGIEANGKYYKMKNLWIVPAKEKKFYYFSIRGNRIYVRVDGDDPFLKTKLSKIEQEDVRIYSVDGTPFPNGKLKIDSSSGGLIPENHNDHLFIEKKGTENVVPNKK